MLRRYACHIGLLRLIGFDCYESRSVQPYIGFSHEFVPIMFQKNEKKNCKKTI